MTLKFLAVICIDFSRLCNLPTSKHFLGLALSWVNQYIVLIAGQKLLISLSAHNAEYVFLMFITSLWVKMLPPHFFLTLRPYTVVVVDGRDRFGRRARSLYFFVVSHCTCTCGSPVQWYRCIRTVQMTFLYSVHAYLITVVNKRDWFDSQTTVCRLTRLQLSPRRPSDAYSARRDFPDGMLDSLFRLAAYSSSNIR